MKEQQELVFVQTRTSPELYEKVKLRAKRTNRSVAGHIRYLLKKDLEAEE